MNKQKRRDVYAAYASFALKTSALWRPVATAIAKKRRDLPSFSPHMGGLLPYLQMSEELLDQITRLWAGEFCYNVRTSIGEEGEG